MTRRVVPYLERPELDDRWDDTVGPAWPEFLFHDRILNDHWHHLFEDFAEFQFYLVEDDGDEVVGVANTVPFSWDGDPATLPEGIDGVMLLAIDQHAAGVAPTTLCAMQAVVTVGNQGRGLAAKLLNAMRALAERRGFVDLVAPVRPSWKDRYPLQEFESYVRWTRDDGLPFDPWVRVHARAGAEPVKVARLSQTVDGTVKEWETWTGMAFPESGDYVVPGALQPVEIDVPQDHGRLVEPNYWMRHRLGSGP